MSEIEYEYIFTSRYSIAERILVNLMERKGEILRDIGAYYLELEKKFRNSYPRDGVVIEQYLDGRVLIKGPTPEVCIKDFKDFESKFQKLFDVKFQEPKLEKVKGTQLMEKSIEFAVPRKVLETVERETKGKYTLNETHYSFNEIPKEKGKEIDISLSKERELGQKLLLKVTVSASDKETVDRILKELREV